MSINSNPYTNKPATSQGDKPLPNSSMKDWVISKILQIDPLRRTARLKNIRGEDIIAGFAENGFNETLPEHDGEYLAILSYGTGEPKIVSYVPESILSEEEFAKNSWIDGARGIHTSESLNGDSADYRSYKDKTSGSNFRGRKPFDLIPGDFSEATPDGSFLRMLLGGENRFGVSELCQILMFADDNLMRTVANNMETFTSWGTVKIENKNDNVKLEIRANDNFQKGTKQEKYKMELDIGKCAGDNFITFKFLNKDNKPTVFTLNNSGSIFFETPGNHISRIHDNKVEMVGDNYGRVTGLTDSIKAKHIIRKSTTRIDEVTGNSEKSVIGTESLNASVNIEYSAGGKASFSGTGDNQTVIGGSDGSDNERVVYKGSLDVIGDIGVMVGKLAGLVATLPGSPITPVEAVAFVSQITAFNLAKDTYHSKKSVVL